MCLRVCVCGGGGGGGAGAPHLAPRTIEMSRVQQRRVPCFGCVTLTTLKTPKNGAERGQRLVHPFLFLWFICSRTVNIESAEGPLHPFFVFLFFVVVLLILQAQRVLHKVNLFR